MDRTATGKGERMELAADKKIAKFLKVSNGSTCTKTDP
jgi:hypothetical protein